MDGNNKYVFIRIVEQAQSRTNRSGKKKKNTRMHRILIDNKRTILAEAELYPSR